MTGISPELLQACQKDDRRAHNELYRTLFGLLMSICVRYASDRDEAQSLLNQGFLKIVLNLEKYSPTAPFEAWARRVMVNTIIDQHRRQKRHRETTVNHDFSESTSAFGHPTTTNGVEVSFSAEMLEAMLRRLPSVQAQVFNLFVVDGYPHKDIAEMLGFSEGTSKWYLSQARHKLQTMLLKTNALIP